MPIMHPARVAAISISAPPASSASSHADGGCSADPAADDSAAITPALPTLPRTSLLAGRPSPRCAAAVTALAGRGAAGAGRCGRGAAGFSMGATICVTRGGWPEELSLLFRLPSSLCASGVTRPRGSCKTHNVAQQVPCIPRRQTSVAQICCIPRAWTVHQLSLNLGGCQTVDVQGMCQSTSTHRRLPRTRRLPAASQSTMSRR